MTPKELRRHVVLACFSSDFLLERLVLKGGTALDVAHNIDLRSSLDVDFSMRDDFDDEVEARENIKKALDSYFFEIGVRVFDFKFFFMPSHRARDSVLPEWGGYRIEFKLTDKNVAPGPIDKLRKTALPVTPDNKRTMKVEISRREWVGDSVDLLIGHFTCVVYAPTLIVSEKLRAICQQTAVYQGLMGNHRSPRPRDFFDICNIIDSVELDFSPAALAPTVECCFAAKRVPLDLLADVGGQDAYDFHGTAWDSVVQAASGRIDGFESYHVRVGELARSILKVLGDV